MMISRVKSNILAKHSKQGKNKFNAEKENKDENTAKVEKERGHNKWNNNNKDKSNVEEERRGKWSGHQVSHRGQRNDNRNNRKIMTKIYYIIKLDISFPKLLFLCSKYNILL